MPTLFRIQHTLGGQRNERDRTVRYTKRREPHYLQTTDAHWKRATEESVGGVAGGSILAERRQSGAVVDDSKTSEKPILIGADESGSAERHAQVDSNHRPTD